MLKFFIIFSSTAPVMSQYAIIGMLHHSKLMCMHAGLKTLKEEHFAHHSYTHCRIVVLILLTDL